MSEISKGPAGHRDAYRNFVHNIPVTRSTTPEVYEAVGCLETFFAQGGRRIVFLFALKERFTLEDGKVHAILIDFSDQVDENNVNDLRAVSQQQSVFSMIKTG